MNTASGAIAISAAQDINFDYINLKSLPEIWQITANQFGDTIALWDPHAKPEVKINYRDLNTQINWFATGLQALSIQSQEKIALFADNSPRWFIADQGNYDLWRCRCGTFCRSRTAGISVYSGK